MCRVASSESTSLSSAFGSDSDDKNRFDENFQAGKILSFIFDLN